MAEFIETTENEIQVQERMKVMREKMARISGNEARPPQPGQPKGILKSKAYRAPVDKEEVKEPQLEDMAVLTSEQITDGVQKAREAVNAPTLDLIAFEEALKKKHGELKEQGITPAIKTERPLQTILPKNKYKVGYGK